MVAEFLGKGKFKIKRSCMYSRILNSLPNYPIKQVRIGLHWTGVVVEKEGDFQCGLASTLEGDHHHHGEPTIPDPGTLESLSGVEMAGWIESQIPLRRSLGCAVINALLPRHPERWVDQNAEAAIRENGQGKKCILIGHFPFAESLNEELEDFNVLELNPTGEDFPASAAPELLPQAGLVAITGMTFINHTLPDLLALCRPDAYVLVLGPSTPLSPVLADYGVDLLAGSSVEDIPAVLAALGQGANFRQVHRAGVRLITQLAG
jgi:uncharacterized protein (DUF4213/DUF364 family)